MAQIVVQITQCSKCGRKMGEVPVLDHLDYMCPVCGSFALLFCTKKNKWR